MPTPDTRPIPNPIESGKKGGRHYPDGPKDPRHPVPKDPNRAKGYYVKDSGKPAEIGKIFPLPSKQQWEERV